MPERDLLVATIAMVLGVSMFYVAIVGDGWCFRMKITDAIVSNQSRGFARGTIGGIASILMLIGIQTFLSSFSPNAVRDQAVNDGIESQRAGLSVTVKE